MPIAHQDCTVRSGIIVVSGCSLSNTESIGEGESAIITATVDSGSSWTTRASVSLTIDGRAFQTKETDDIAPYGDTVVEFEVAWSEVHSSLGDGQKSVGVSVVDEVCVG